ncbi:MAG TPA: hypothetical protein VGQ42_00810 [Candidatus Dormibacteraeota bacterium]|jgi:hypothetical protein|nr:hypothetical protein [Candidatus Dormibacteraeota bacterium]
MSLPALAPVVTVLVLAELAVGTVVAAWLSDLGGGVGRGFAGTTALICAGIMGLDLGLLLILPDPSQLLHTGVDPGRYAEFVHWLIGFTGASLGYALFSAVGTDVARRVVGGVAVGVGATAITMAALVFGGPLGGGLAAAVAFVPATLLGGSALCGMLLGHWYLITPDLSFRPLRHAVYGVFVAVAVQVAAITGALLVADPDARHSLLSGHYGVSFWLLVVLAGLVFTAAVNGLTLYFARMRANQPATAMLYVLIITVLMGIVPAHLLYFLTRVPV